MNFLCKCLSCQETWWCRGEEEADVNVTTLTGEQQNCPNCDSDDFEIVEAEYDSFLDDYI